MSFRDWTQEQKEYFDEQAYSSIFNNIPSVPFLSEDQQDEASELFRLGWLTWPTEQAVAEEYRQQFYDLTYMPEGLFRALGNWVEYRALYDEVDSG